MSPRQQIFDPGIIARHLSGEALLALMQVHFAEGMDDGSIREIIPSLNPGTMSRRNIPYSDAMQELVLLCLEDLRASGALGKIPNGADRDIPEAVQWNGFVQDGREGIAAHGLQSLMRCPLPEAINHGLVSGSIDALARIREARGLGRHAGMGAAEQVASRATLRLGRDDLPAIAAAAATGALRVALGHTWFPDSVRPCPRTGEFISWAEDALLAPVLGTRIWPDGPGPSVFTPLGAWESPKPLRHVTLDLPSGQALLTSWIRVPGFEEGFEEKEQDAPSIESDLGVDMATRQTYERLGILNVWVGSGQVLARQDDLLRIGKFDEDHETFWEERGEDWCRTDAPMPDVSAGLNDFREMLIADREIVLDVIMAGAAAGAAGAPATREEAVAALDAFVKADRVCEIDFDPGTTLHVYMATGHGAHDFHETFRSPDLADWPAMTDRLVLAPRPLEVDPLLVEEADWPLPERVAIPTQEDPAP